ncbi:MAG: DUF3467 domain-containing protein [Terriglobia bacterium]
MAEDASTNPTAEDSEGQLKVTSVSPQALPTIYINSAQVAMGPFEIRLYLCETGPTGDSKGVTITQKLCVLLAPEFARFMAGKILEGMAEFEKRFGSLRNVQATVTPQDNPSPAS